MVPPGALSVLYLLNLLGLAQCQSFGLPALGDPLPFIRQLAKLPQQVRLRKHYLPGPTCLQLKEPAFHKVQPIPVQQQRLYLALIGEGIKGRQALSCNPFGGASDCVTLPATSTYAEACGRSEVEVRHISKSTPSESSHARRAYGDASLGPAGGLHL